MKLKQNKIQKKKKIQDDENALVIAQTGIQFGFKQL